MEKINVNLVRMPQIFIFGIPVLLTPHRVSRETVHLGLHCYELQGDLEKPHSPMILARHIDNEFCGTVLSVIPLLIQDITHLTLMPGDVSGEPRTMFYTPSEFEAQFSNPMQAKKTAAPR